jgi:hypothetical protein
VLAALLEDFTLIELPLLVAVPFSAGTAPLGVVECPVDIAEHTSRNPFFA